MLRIAGNKNALSHNWHVLLVLIALAGCQSTSMPGTTRPVDPFLGFGRSRIPPPGTGMTAPGGNTYTWPNNGTAPPYSPGALPGGYPAAPGAPYQSGPPPPFTPGGQSSGAYAPPGGVNYQGAPVGPGAANKVPTWSEPAGARTPDGAYPLPRDSGPLGTAPRGGPRAAISPEPPVHQATLAGGPATKGESIRVIPPAGGPKSGTKSEAISLASRSSRTGRLRDIMELPPAPPRRTSATSAAAAVPVSHTSRAPAAAGPVATAQLPTRLANSLPRRSRLR